MKRTVTFNTREGRLEERAAREELQTTSPPSGKKSRERRGREGPAPETQTANRRCKRSFAQKVFCPRECLLCSKKIIRTLGILADVFNHPRGVDPEGRSLASLWTAGLLAQEPDRPQLLKADVTVPLRPPIVFPQKRSNPEVFTRYRLL